MSISRMAEFLSLHPTHFCPALPHRHRTLWPRPTAVTRGRMGLYNHALESSSKGLSTKIQPVAEFSSWPPAEFIWNSPLGFQQAFSRTVAAIIICCCDRDGRCPSSASVKFEALDALGFGKWGGRILMAAEFLFHSLSLGGKVTDCVGGYLLLSC